MALQDELLLMRLALQGGGDPSLATSSPLSRATSMQVGQVPEVRDVPTFQPQESIGQFGGVSFNPTSAISPEPTNLKTPMGISPIAMGLSALGDLPGMAPQQIPAPETQPFGVGEAAAGLTKQQASRPTQVRDLRNPAGSFNDKNFNFADPDAGLTIGFDRASNSLGGAVNQGAQQAAVGAAVGGQIAGPWGALAGAVGGFVDAIERWKMNEMFGSGKGTRQRQRDNVRDTIKNFLGEDRTFRGVKGDLLQLEHHELDMSNPLAAQAIAIVNPLAIGASPEDASIREDLGALMARAILDGSSNEADLVANAKLLARELGISQEQVRRGLRTAWDTGQFDRQGMQVLTNGFATLAGRGDEGARQEYESITGLTL